MSNKIALSGNRLNSNRRSASVERCFSGRLPIVIQSVCQHMQTVRKTPLTNLWPYFRRENLKNIRSVVHNNNMQKRDVFKMFKFYVYMRAFKIFDELQKTRVRFFANITVLGVLQVYTYVVGNGCCCFCDFYSTVPICR